MRFHVVPGSEPRRYEDEEGNPVPLVKVFPFMHFVDLADLPEGKVVLIREMPSPLNLSVHVANEHQIDDRTAGGDQHRLVWLHMNAHTYGRFRDGAQHWHDARFHQ